MSTTITRGVRIIESLSGQGRTVAELASEFDVHRTTMFRDLKTLEKERYVRRRANGRYVLGLRVIELGQVALSNIALHRAADAHARALHRAVGHTIHVAALLDDQLTYVHKVEDDPPRPTYSRLGAPVPLYCTALGKAVLAHMSVERRAEALENETWRRFTPATLLNAHELERQLDEVSRRGWAQDDGEFEAFMHCVAVPILCGPQVLGALSCSVPKSIAGLDELRLRIPVLVRAARMIARDIR